MVTAGLAVPAAFASARSIARVRYSARTESVTASTVALSCGCADLEACAAEAAVFEFTSFTDRGARGDLLCTGLVTDDDLLVFRPPLPDLDPAPAARFEGDFGGNSFAVDRRDMGGLLSPAPLSRVSLG